MVSAKDLLPIEASTVKIQSVWYTANKSVLEGKNMRLFSGISLRILI